MAKKFNKEKRELSEFEIKKIEFEKQKRKQEKKDDENKINNELKKFSQEMLILIYNRSFNHSINRLIAHQIIKNNTTIYSINSDCESGSIFDYLKNLSNENVKEIMNLRETDEKLVFDAILLNDFSSNAENIFEKKLEGKLDEEKKEFCQKHNLSNELEFEFYKKNYNNQELIKCAKDVQESYKDWLGTDDPIFEDYAQAIIDKSKPKHHK